MASRPLIISSARRAALRILLHGSFTVVQQGLIAAHNVVGVASNVVVQAIERLRDDIAAGAAEEARTAGGPHAPAVNAPGVGGPN